MKLSIRILTLAGLAGATCLAASAQTTTNLISQTTFDPAAASPWSYGYFYGNNGLGVYGNNRAFYFPDDVDMTNAVYQYTFDDTDLNGVTGWGTGTGSPLYRENTDPALLVSGDRADYFVTFDAKVVGLAEGQTSANGEFQMQFRFNDGTDKNLLQVNLPFQPTSEWKTFRFNLLDGSLGDGTSDANFEARRGEVTDLRFNVNFHEPFNAFGYDGDNEFYLDNIKVEVIERPTVTTPTPTFARPIVDWNMDDKPVWYVYSYDWSANDNHATFSSMNSAGSNEEGVDGSTAWAVSLDNSSFVENTPSYAGIGSGGGGPVDFTIFDTADLAAYRVTFDARAAGLAEGRESTTGVLQVHLEAPDDTLVVDENTDADNIGRFDFQVGGLTSEWQPYSFKFDRAGSTAATKENFANLFNKLVGLRTQWQIENAASAADWGYDADNVFYIDNIKIERIYEGLGALTFSPEGAELVLSWTDAATGTTKLQSASTVTGPYTDVTTEGATYRASTTDGQRYFRLVWEAPVAP